MLLSSFGGYGAYLYVSRTQGATRASTLLYLTPPTTMLWAALMFGDRVPPAGLAGLALVGDRRGHRAPVGGHGARRAEPTSAVEELALR